MIAEKNETFGLMKTLVDAHTMGIHAAAALLNDCGYHVLISPKSVEHALERLSSVDAQRDVLDWIDNNHISRIGFSYRLDPDKAVELMGRLTNLLSDKGYWGGYNSRIKSIFFAGLAPACKKIDSIFDGRIPTFRGGESAEETLLVMGVPLESIPKTIKDGCQYDKDIGKFGQEVILSGDYKRMPSQKHINYPEYGTKKDTLLLRLDNNCQDGFHPIIRAHSGPYSEDMKRLDMLKEFHDWCQKLAKAGYLDVLSIGSSQLSQSRFGKNWEGIPNGGGVPVNSEAEYADIWDAARPMLVRTYSGTSDIKKLAEIYERSINISWHALSLWWFNQIDGRGPNSLYNNLKEHLETIRWISTTNKPVETNVPHHFAFRGADDITYVISGYLAAKAAKMHGTKTFVLQNMLNTPRSTWGIQDLAKSRTMIKLVKELEDSNFRVILQTRAGLDYFKPDLDAAKAQLASVTALMDDIDPNNEMSPEIIHVVSYSEALFLATPDILNDSIRITLTALNEYRKLKKQYLTPNVMSDDILRRQYELETSCRRIVKAMEENIPDLYSPKGLYLAFVSGWLPVPELWSDSDEFIHAKSWGTRMTKGSVVLCDHDIIVTTDYRINRCISNLPSANYIFKHFNT